LFFYNVCVGNYNIQTIIDMIRIIFCFRLRTHRTKNTEWKNSDYILCDRRYTFDAVMPVKYRRYNGSFLQVPLLESVLLYVHQAAEESTVSKEVPQSKVHYKISRVRFYELSFGFPYFNRVQARLLFNSLMIYRKDVKYYGL